VEVPAGPEAAVVVAMTVVVAAPAVVVMTVVAAAAEDEAGVAVEAAEDDKVALAGRYAPVTSLLEFRLARFFFWSGSYQTYLETPPLSTFFM
jgi:hypothetical protein